MNLTNLLGLPDAFVAAVKNDPYSGGGDISVTKLIDSLPAILAADSLRGVIDSLTQARAKKKAILLLAHIDVVEAKREDWTRDPFTLVEENGNFYARGAMDDKAQAAIWTDLFIRLHGEHYVPPRPLKLALTCGEEGGGQRGEESEVAPRDRVMAASIVTATFPSLPSNFRFCAIVG